MPDPPPKELKRLVYPENRIKRDDFSQHRRQLPQIANDADFLWTG